MADEAVIRALREHLFADPERSVFALLDGASVDGLVKMLWEQKPEHVCLYRGELEPDMAEVAPYLIRLVPDAEFTEWVLARGWGNHWGIFAVTDADLRALRRHFRTFTMVRDPDGKLLYFRYYDPRVLRVYLPTCNEEEMAIVFGPVACYLLEDEDPRILLRFRQRAGAPERVKVPLVEGAEASP
jgi:hypothetical protein